LLTLANSACTFPPAPRLGIHLGLSALSPGPELGCELSARQEFEVVGPSLRFSYKGSRGCSSLTLKTQPDRVRCRSRREGLRANSRFTSRRRNLCYANTAAWIGALIVRMATFTSTCQHASLRRQRGLAWIANLGLGHSLALAHSLVRPTLAAAARRAATAHPDPVGRAASCLHQGLHALIILLRLHQIRLEPVPELALGLYKRDLRCAKLKSAFFWLRFPSACVNWS